jgi:hypothetical protein
MFSKGSLMDFFGNFLSKLKLSDTKEDERIQSNQIATDNDDGAIEVDNGVSQYMFNIDWSYNSQAELIETYREVANYSTVDYAIEDIINEMVSFSEHESAIQLNLSNLEEDLSENIRKKIYEKYDKIVKLLELDNTVHKRARQFYIDGRLAYQKVIDQKKPRDGILDVVELDTRYVSKVRNKEYNRETKTIENIEEYFIYDENIQTSRNQAKQNNRFSQNKQFKEALRLNPETLTYVTSGLTDLTTGMAISWLHKAVTPANQLRMMENALVIYRITRAPERRIFYVDTANLPKSKAEQYIRHLKNMHRNKMSFDPESGTFKDRKHLQTMQEDYWLPRNSSGRGTEVSTLPGGQNLSDIDDVIYFQKQLYKALNVPTTRLEPENSIMGGRGAEVSRDELKFSKFVSKIRKRFNTMLLDLLRTELILTKVMTAAEWDEIAYKIDFIYAQDMQLEEMRKAEIKRDRLDLAQLYQPYVGRYVSNKFIREEVLMQSEQEREQLDKEIQEEKNDEQYKEPEEGGFGRF